jgi:hypothetical protein
MTIDIPVPETSEAAPMDLELDLELDLSVDNPKPSSPTKSIPSPLQIPAPPSANAITPLEIAPAEASTWPSVTPLASSVAAVSKTIQEVDEDYDEEDSASPTKAPIAVSVAIIEEEQEEEEVESMTVTPMQSIVPLLPPTELPLQPQAVQPMEFVEMTGVAISAGRVPPIAFAAGANTEEEEIIEEEEEEEGGVVLPVGIPSQEAAKITGAEEPKPTILVQVPAVFETPNMSLNVAPEGTPAASTVEKENAPSPIASASQKPVETANISLVALAETVGEMEAEEGELIEKDAEDTKDA